MTLPAKKWDKSYFPTADIQTAAENDLLYDRFGIANLDDYNLTVSIKASGIQEPLAISADGFLLSGHRRLAAARYLGLKSVPVRVVDLAFNELAPAERLATLRRFNQQREKSPGERIREQLLDIEPEQAHKELRSRRIKNFTMAGKPAANVALGDVKKRARITTRQFLEGAQRVVEENREYWPLTVRRVHYLLLNDPPLRHDKKPDSVYLNDKGSYKALTNLLIRARLSEDIPMEAIEDSTRPIQLGGGFSTFEEFVADETEDFLTGYSRDLMQGQPHHIEIMLEKNALRTVIEAVARDYCIPVTTGRGFSSLSPRYDLWRRFRHSGKSKLVLSPAAKPAPAGEEIEKSSAGPRRDDCGMKNIPPTRGPLTADDVRDNDLPSDMDAKPSSPNYKKFVAKHGVKVAELDAAPVKLLQNSLRKAIESVIDVEEFNAQIDLERQDSAHVEAHRRVVFNAIRGGT